MYNSVIDKLVKLCNEGEELTGDRQFGLWSAKAFAFLKVAVGPTEADDFSHIQAEDSWAQHSLRIGHLQGLIARMQSQEPAPRTEAPAGASAAISNTESRKVFLVHGHDNEAKEGTARFLQKLGLEPIVLHEQPSSGRTLIEKFELYSGDIAFAVVLLTPDDFGGVATNPSTSRPRARQNVILELGYFMGRLGRSHVAALYKGEVELPSDYQGILYIAIDPAGAWKAKLAQEFVQAKLPIEVSGLLGG